MKKLLFGLMLLLTTVSMSAQSRYETMKNYVRSQGYNIGSEQSAAIVQGGTAYTYLNFAPSEYMIVAVSNDEDVTDLDVAIYLPTGVVLAKDDDESSIAVATFTVYWDVQMKVVMTNYASNTPYYASTCRYFVAWR
jgi:hypothetical protein